ncbi:MAG TPA: hypothetical protein VMN81_13750, partial [Vicinamibacterales bacterium]|nr:hypothetical protein [Vicinamibacterales bacterium]
MRRGLALFLTLVPIALGAPASARAPQSAEPEIVTSRPILFDSDRTGRLEIYALDADASAPPRFAAWSPDGRRIAFILTVDGNADIA